MIQDIYPHHLDNQYKPGKKPTADSRIIAWKEGRMLLKIEQDQQKMSFPKARDFGYLETVDYLFTLEEECTGEQKPRKKTSAEKVLCFCLWRARKLKHIISITVL